MALRQLRTIGDPILGKRSKEIKEIDDKLLALIDDMEETMLATDGVGIAAVQVGVLKRVVLVRPEDETRVCINPVMLHQEGSQIGIEGCLSVPNRSGQVERPNRVKVSYMDVHGKEHIVEAEGFEARIFCHEIDHINGTLYVERLVEDEDSVL
ncbi:MAG: peptide deformylase [Tissierellia bacterium]|nr:peptide deformylase [Tissierellia bacterium]